MVKRKMAKQIYPTVEIQFDGSTFSQTTKTSAKTTTVTFKLDEPFEQELEELGITKKVNIGEKWIRLGKDITEKHGK